MYETLSPIERRLIANMMYYQAHEAEASAATRQAAEKSANLVLIVAVDCGLAPERVEGESGFALGGAFARYFAVRYLREVGGKGLLFQSR